MISNNAGLTVELHMLREHGASCMNRDENGQPKRMMFGGTWRGDLSPFSQRFAIRQWLIANADALGLSGLFGVRTQYIPERLISKLVGMDRSQKDSFSVAYGLFGTFVKEKKGKEDDEPTETNGENGEKESGNDEIASVMKTSVNLFLGPDEEAAILKVAIENWDSLLVSGRTQLESDKATRKEEKAEKAARKTASKNAKKGSPPVTAAPESEAKKLAKKQADKSISAAAKNAKTVVAKAMKSAKRSPDTALFGRMIVNLDELNIAAAVNMAHAVSTNHCPIHEGFYTATDDFHLAGGGKGFATSGYSSFICPCWYIFSEISVRQLAETLNDVNLAIKVAVAYLQGFVLARSTARATCGDNSQLPLFVRVICRTGATRSMVGAFSLPVKPDEEKGIGTLRASIERLKQFESNLDEMHGDNKVLDLVSAPKSYWDGAISCQEMVEKFEAFIKAKMA